MRIFGHLQRHRRPSVVVHVPKIGADRHRHRDAIAFVIRSARRVAVGDTRQVIADHLLIVLKTTACQHHRLASLDVDRLTSPLGTHAKDLLGIVALDQFAGRCFIQNGDRALLDQTLEPLPGVGITIGRPVVELVHAVRPRKVGEFDADRLMLMLLGIGAEACKPRVVLAHFFRPYLHHGCRDCVGPAQGSEIGNGLVGR